MIKRTDASINGPDCLYQIESDKQPIVAVLKGRLGNCMFQIAACLSYAKKKNRPFYFILGDLQALNREFVPFIFRFEAYQEVPENWIEWQEGKAMDYTPIDYDDERYPMILEGYFQDERYFDREDVKEWFHFTDDTFNYVKEKYGDLSDFVSISVRRGDYVLLGIDTPAEWYENAYEKYFKGRKCIVFSDDIEWCKENIHIPDAVFAEGGDAISDLCAGSMCKDHISYNGSFGWWVCYLGEREDSTIVVKKDWWHGTDNHCKIVPDRWIEY